VLAAADGREPELRAVEQHRCPDLRSVLTTYDVRCTPQRVQCEGELLRSYADTHNGHIGYFGRWLPLLVKP
jgi:hypothetical protein